MKKILHKEEFINKANLIHNNLYDYSLVNYKCVKDKIKIICKEHGIFEQRVNNHLQGRACPNCGRIKSNLFLKLRIVTQTEFIKKITSIHGNKYDYSFVNYINMRNNIIIKCNICKNTFEQKAYSHLNGNGCKKCSNEKARIQNKENPTGWSYVNWEKAGNKSNHFDSFKVYIIECWNNEEKFYKIGKTYKTVKNRFRGSFMTYEYKIIKEIIGTPKEVSELEIKLKQKNKEYKYLPKIYFCGINECFKIII